MKVNVICIEILFCILAPLAQTPPPISTAGSKRNAWGTPATPTSADHDA